MKKGTIEDIAKQSVKDNLEKTIKQFENLLNATVGEQEREALKKIIENLKSSGDEINKKILSPEPPATAASKMRSTITEKQQNKRNKFLLEIFKFYAKQHVPTGIAFEELQQHLNQIDMGEFTSFCRDFKLGLSWIKLKEIYNAVSQNHMPLKFPHFEKSLISLQKALNEEKIKDIKKKIKSVEKTREIT